MNTIAPYLWGTLVPVVGLASFVYVVRKIREWQWGWVRNRYPLDGRIFVVTGANTGLGYDTAKALVARNAVVIMGCRSLERAEAAIARIRQSTGNGQLVPIQLDLASFESIKSFATKIRTLYPKFNCLINNAGMVVQTNQAAFNGLELTFATNHLGHFLLTELLADNIRQNASRVVVVSSMLHQRGDIDLDRLGQFVDNPQVKGRNKYYNDSKLANFYFARELYRNGVDAHVLCPGLCHTDFFRAYEPRWYHYVMFSPVVWLFLRSSEQGAQNIIFCATDNVNTDAQNPLAGYFVTNLKQRKSKTVFDDSVSKGLWQKSLEMCEIAL